VAGGTHLLSLEGLSLSPGDLISYHARATDAANEPDRLVSTDLYFMDVRPYEQRYHRAAGGGGGGGGGGGAGNAELTAQQRSLVVALFKLERDREIMDKATFQERAATLEQAQARIRDRVEAVVRRIAPRAFISGNDGYRRMAEEMPRAARAMVETEAALAVRELPQALPRARKALLHLQRADAAFRDVQVAMQNSQGAGNGAQNELADLFRLEMDKFRNPYESLQRGQWNQPQKALDDALDKLRELARRQERELERARLRGERAQGGETSQQALAQEVEKLMRELQRLTRHRNQASAAQARKSLQDLEAAKRAMDRAGRNGDPEAAKQALERLQTVRRELEEAAVAEQRDIQRRLRNEDSRSTNPGDEDDRTTAQRQRALADDVRRLSREIAGLQRRARGENRTEAASELEAAGRALRQRQVEARLRRAAEALEQGESTGAGESSATGEDLEAVRQRLARAEGKVRAQGAPDAEDTLERLQAMVRSLKAEQQRLTDAANRGDDGGKSGERSRAGAPSANGSGAAGDGGGATAAGGGPAGPAGGGYDRGYSIDPSEFRQRTLARREELEALRDRFADVGDTAGDVDALIAALDGLGGGDANPEALRRRHAELLTALQELEARLRREVRETPQPVVTRPPVRVAPEDAAEVERYYRNLSESRRLD
jgi:hypothetical protein